VALRGVLSAKSVCLTFVAVDVAVKSAAAVAFAAAVTFSSLEPEANFVLGVSFAIMKYKLFVS